MTVFYETWGGLLSGVDDILCTPNLRRYCCTAYLDHSKFYWNVHFIPAQGCEAEALANLSQVEVKAGKHITLKAEVEAEAKFNFCLQAEMEPMSIKIAKPK